MKKEILLAGSLVLAGSLSAQWQLIDDMESYTPDTQLDSDPWNWYTVPTENFSVLPSATAVADPFNAGQGQVLSFAPGVPAAGSSNATLERALPEGQRIQDPFPETGKSTFYFKVGRPLVEGAPGEADITWGLVAESARDETTMQHAYGSYSVLGRYEIDGIMDIRDGGTYNNLVETALNTEVYYEVWFVVDHTNNTFSQYIKGGTDFPEQTMLYENAAYRFSTFDDLETILIVTTAGGADDIKGKDPIYFDDFYIDVAAENLTSPGEGGGGAAGTLGKLINISTRGVVGTGDDVLIGSLIIGTDSQQVLIQAVAQELAGVTGALADPVLELRNPADNSLIASNDDWESDQMQEITDAWGGNPPLAAGSTSAALLITLDQGSYSAVITGKDGATGVALVEIYEID